MNNNNSNKYFALTIDFEDWFQVENLRSVFPPENWDKCESRIERNGRKVLDLLEKHNIKATFFVLGWIAERYPNLVKEIHEAGHEIATHGYGHLLNSKLSEKEIEEDIKKSIKILNDITGQEILGYRAPNFSISDKVLEILYRCGIKYDSSFHDFFGNSRYGKIHGDYSKFFFHKSGVFEIPLPVLRVSRFSIPLSGGGYFRLYPFWLTKALVKKYLSENNTFVLYLHPWEFDFKQPRVSGVKLSYRLRHYIGLDTTEKKLDSLLIWMRENFDVEFVTMKNLYELFSGISNRSEVVKHA